MKLWISSDYNPGAWYDVDKIAPMQHGRTETGEILYYYTEDKTTIIGAYYWNSQYNEYRKISI